ncbi:MAG: DUF805 domain-containing protein [Bauldia sp.]
MAAPATTDQLLHFFFRSNGRIGRQEYALGIGVIYSLNLSILFYLLVRETMSPVMLILLVLLDVIILIGLAVLMAKRCHDLGLPGLYFLFIFVPFVGLFWPFVLAFLPGNPAANAYGMPPVIEPE